MDWIFNSFNGYGAYVLSSLSLSLVILTTYFMTLFKERRAALQQAQILQAFEENS